MSIRPLFILRHICCWLISRFVLLFFFFFSSFCYSLNRINPNGNDALFRSRCSYSAVKWYFTILKIYSILTWFFSFATELSLSLDESSSFFSLAAQPNYKEELGGKTHTQKSMKYSCILNRWAKLCVISLAQALNKPFIFLAHIAYAFTQTRWTPRQNGANQRSN